MPKIVPIVEGPGDIEAVPELLRRILYDLYHVYDWEIAHPLKANNLTTLRNNVNSFITYAHRIPGCGAVLILLDLDDGCPKIEALSLANEIRHTYHFTYPTCVVLAHCEYESWFLASLDTIAGNCDIPEGLSSSSLAENRRGAKECLTRLMPPGIAYKETYHQVRMTQFIDLNLAQTRSRSFRRLCHAISQLITTNTTSGFVTP
ncbi:MAG: hypothetical protein C0391_05615 [Anaerolinea sp.]|nr:hypothetical protein [Anaerolinea sp.]